jgi:hypothetical protein
MSTYEDLEWDARQEEYESRLYDQILAQYHDSGQFFIDVDNEIDSHIDEIVHGHIETRLRDFYLANPDTAKASIALLVQSQDLHKIGCYSPAQVFGGAAIEVTFKRVLFFPIVHGFVPIDSIAQMVVQVFTKSISEIGRFQGLLIHAISLFSSIDVLTFKPGSSTTSLWEEATQVRKQRNAILHEAKSVSKEEAEQSILVAETLLDTVFPALLKTINLHRHSDGSIYAGYACKGGC